MLHIHVVAINVVGHYIILQVYKPVSNRLTLLLKAMTIQLFPSNKGDSQHMQHIIYTLLQFSSTVCIHTRI